MSDRRDRPRRLSIRGSREVVYCHECDNEWLRTGQDLSCPRCHSQVTEILEAGNDPRPGLRSSPRHEQHILDEHDPWMTDDSDPDEMLIEEHFPRTPGGHGRRPSSSTRRPEASESTRRRPSGPLGANQNQDETIRSFEEMLGGLLGPTYRSGQTGRSTSNTLYNEPGWSGRTWQWGGDSSRPSARGGTFSFSVGTGPAPARPTNGNGDPFSVLTDMLNSMGMGQTQGGARGPGQMPPGFEPFPSGFGTRVFMTPLFGVGNMMNGDAVHTQEGFDRIMSQLMEQHTTSNAPGPAPKSDIESLPKKKLDEKMLGPEGTGECSVCMDDVKTGDEVVVLPCSHWFHETCATAWLSEHNTCPICRKSITSGQKDQSNNAATSGASHSAAANAANIPEASRSPLGTPRNSPRNEQSSGRHEALPHRNRQQERLDAIRRAGRISNPPSRHGSIHDDSQEYSPRQMGRRNSLDRADRGSRSGMLSESRRTHSRSEADRASQTPGNIADDFRRQSESSSKRHRDRERDRHRRSTRDRMDDMDERRGSRGSRDSGSSRNGSASTSGGLPSWLRDTFSSGSSRRG